MSDQRLKGWNKQKTVFTYSEDREFGPGLCNALLYADLGLAKATGRNFQFNVFLNHDFCFSNPKRKSPLPMTMMEPMMVPVEGTS